jgi:putative nucleotidyltransferase with HDIG domain
MSVASEPGRPRVLAAFIGVVGMLGALAIYDAASALPATAHPMAWLSFGVLALVAGSFALKVPGVDVRISVSDTFFITSAVLFGPAPATLSIAIDSVAMTLKYRRRQSLLRVVFNLTGPALSLWAGARLFHQLAGSGPLYGSAMPADRVILPLASFAAVYFVLNSGLTAVAIALEKRVPAFDVWRLHFAVISLNYFAAASVAFFLFVVVQYVSLLALAAVLPVFAVFYMAMRSWMGRLEDAERHVATVDRLYLSTIEALSTAIEAKDGVTSSHIHRVQHYAMGLARALEITDALELKAIQAAALLHDTGKLAVPERILNKPGKLTAAEFETMKLHVDVGADILSAIDFPYPVVPIVRAHHENWDGTGYPRGLRAESIPVGARILSIVDCYDALTSDRPYRPALSDEEAVRMIGSMAGTKYDPRLVEVFARVRAELAPDLVGQPAMQAALRQISKAAEPPRRAEPEPQPAGEHPDTMLALVSLGRVVGGRSSIADVAALAWSQIRHVVPTASCALFVPETGGDAMTAAFVAGEAASMLQGLRITAGDRLSGWVADHGQSLVNSDARLELGDEAALVGLEACLAVPLFSGEQMAGVLTLYTAGVFSGDQVRTIQMVAPHLGQMLVALPPRSASQAQSESGGRTSSLRVVASR